MFVVFPPEAFWVVGYVTRKPLRISPLVFTLQHRSHDINAHNLRYSPTDPDGGGSVARPQRVSTLVVDDDELA